MWKIGIVRSAARAIGIRRQALRRHSIGLVDEGKVTRHSVGWYSLGSGVADRPPAEPLPSAIEVDEVGGSPEALIPEERIGDGDEVVYVYFHEAERKLAMYESRDWWPCKVGFTAGSLTARILGQGPATSMARLPIVGLVIAGDDGRGLERALHFALDEADARIDDALGNEWFETSPSRVKDWFVAQQKAIAILRRSTDLQQSSKTRMWAHSVEQVIWTPVAEPGK